MVGYLSITPTNHVAYSQSFSAFVRLSPVCLRTIDKISIQLILELYTFI